MKTFTCVTLLKTKIAAQARCIVQQPAQAPA
jgi:hypothetical protein